MNPHKLLFLVENRKTIQLFAEKLVEIDVMVRRMVMESFGIEKYIDEHLNSTEYRMRLMKYIAPPDGDANTTVNDNADLLAKLNIDGDDGVGPNVGVKVNADISDDVNANADVGANVNDDLNVDAEANVAIGGGVNANTDLGVGVNVNSNVDVNAITGATGGDGVEANDDNEEKKLGLPSHTDKNLFTVLFQHEIEGLEVLTEDEKWIRVKPSPNTFIVIAGDSLCVSFFHFVFTFYGTKILTFLHSSRFRAHLVRSCGKQSRKVELRVFGLYK